MIVVLLFSILPWGAYTAAWSASTRVEMGETIAVTTLAEVSGQKVTSDQTAQSAVKRCRIATLPGTRCSTDHAVLPTQPEPNFEASRGLMIAQKAAAWRDLSPAPPRSPPRSF
ncbi:hypothetical protein K3757_12890 [Sulfitobacter sp. S223]|uniref:hypothetical protein n=1 Tax=Sulfitobacter sp. S223 TaxID=2867023 RepID=UPI0021A44242|nr:hypothetical protein [Sulfitobacter sp. S223]UWR25358.1 hypothetical protein K3757_12890 [Sulfitobacter sp. S223]